MKFDYEKIKPLVEKNVFKELVEQIESNESFGNLLKEKINENEPILEHLFFKRSNEGGIEYQDNFNLQFELINGVVEVSIIPFSTPF